PTHLTLKGTARSAHPLPAVLSGWLPRVGPLDRPLGPGRESAGCCRGPTRSVAAHPPAPTAIRRAAHGGSRSAHLPRGTPLAPPQILGTARRIAFPSFTKTRYSTSRAL